MTEQERKVKFTTVLSLMNELMMHTGNNTAHDYDGVNNLDDIILYLILLKQSLPVKEIADDYVVKKLEKKMRTLTWKEQLNHDVECELSDAIRSTDMEEMIKIRKVLSDALNTCEEYEEDFMEKLYEHRAKVLSRVLDFVKGLRRVVSDGLDVTIETDTPWDKGILDQMMKTLQHEFPDLELKKVMKNINVNSKDEATIQWDWIG